ncbi:efflux RND transporter permease subunit [Klebsiella pneumoniae]|nr:efflux RND transporter permease subunit [Klebsiella pneumoniae]
MAAMDNLAKRTTGVRRGVGGKFVTGKRSASQLPGLIVLSVLVVFMVLAALYESWSIPFAVMLVEPLGLLGAVLAVSVTNMTNDVFSKWV